MSDAKGLSEVQRYYFGFDENYSNQLLQHETGEWMKYSDHAALAERLKAVEKERDLQCTLKHNLINRIEERTAERDSLKAKLDDLRALGLDVMRGKMSALEHERDQLKAELNTSNAVGAVGNTQNTIGSSGKAQ